jgi:hypothetical protein
MRKSVCESSGARRRSIDRHYSFGSIHPSIRSSKPYASQSCFFYHAIEILNIKIKKRRQNLSIGSASRSNLTPLLPLWTFHILPTLEDLKQMSANSLSLSLSLVNGNGIWRKEHNSWTKSRIYKEIILHPYESKDHRTCLMCRQSKRCPHVSIDLFSNNVKLSYKKIKNFPQTSLYTFTPLWASHTIVLHENIIPNIYISEVVQDKVIVRCLIFRDPIVQILAWMFDFATPETGHLDCIHKLSYMFSHWT